MKMELIARFTSRNNYYKKQHNGRGEEVNFEGVIGWVYLKF
jgi:hypothetical protein